MFIRYKLLIFFFVLLCTNFVIVLQAFPEDNQSSMPDAAPKELKIDRAVMCEEIKDFTPQNPAVVFSIKIGKVSCFNSFDPVPEKTFIYHKWFHRDDLSTTKRLTLQPPRWGTYSTIQLRETDKGPWRVEISDQKGNLLRILRFSITD
jgi:hypothetical protein